MQSAHGRPYPDIARCLCPHVVQNATDFGSDVDLPVLVAPYS